MKLVERISPPVHFSFHQRSNGNLGPGLVQASPHARWIMNGNEACQPGSQLTVGVYVGVYVSKLKLDVDRLRSGKVRNKVFSNDRAGFKALRNG